MSCSRRVGVAAAGDRSDVGRSRGDAGLGAQARDGDDETRGRSLAHIPTRTDLALAAFRLR